MRVLVVSQYFWPENFRINDLVADLVGRGHTVTVLTGQPNYPEGVILPEFAAKPSRYARYAGAEVLRIPLVPRGRGKIRLALNYASFALAGSTLGAWKLRGRTADVIFNFEVSPITAALPAIVIGALKRTPVFIWILDLWPDTLSAVGAVRSPRVLNLVKKLVAFIYRRCDLILAQSEAFAENVRTLSGDGQRFRYFPNWAEPLFTGTLEAVELAPEMRPYLGTFNILFAGNIGEAQDFPAVLDAAEATRDRPDIRWLIVGDGRAGESVRTEIRRRGLEKSVVMFGRHPLERMPSFFRGASVLLVSLKRDPVFALTIPGKVQSYLPTGLPLVGMLDGEGARVIESSGAGLTCPAGDGAALAERVKEIAGLTGQERTAMGARGRAYSAREFDRGQLLSRFETWMEEVAAGMHASGRRAR
ncbi:MAG TPA: glycosyltransferase family 4 protein [Gemmatimonadaceae bacterium]|nr:glycosyltransferase family 4 protein [Gemmatimonadaceae bacterium]